MWIRGERCASGRVCSTNTGAAVAQTGITCLSHRLSHLAACSALHWLYENGCAPGAPDMQKAVFLFMQLSAQIFNLGKVYA